MVTNNYQRISFLGERIKNNLANKQEKDEYMQLLYNDGLIPSDQYNNYVKNSNNEELLKGGLVIGAVALIAYLLSKSS
jgi:hypothetical protein